MQKYYAHADSVSTESKQFDFFVEVYLAGDVDARLAADAKRIEELERELERCSNEVSDLRGFINGMKRHVAAAAKMYGLT